MASDGGISKFFKLFPWTVDGFNDLVFKKSR